MLTEKRDIDLLFKEKLGDYEQAPPLFLWTNIKAKINAHKREQRAAYLKIVGIAAAVVLAFLAGWYTTVPAKKGKMTQNNVAATNGEVNKVHQLQENPVCPDKHDNTNNTNGHAPSPSLIKVALQGPDLSSIAAFTPNTSMTVNGLIPTKKAGDMVLSHTEKDFLDQFQINLKPGKEIADRTSPEVMAVQNGTAVPTKPTITQTYDEQIPDQQVAMVFDKTNLNNRRWGVKAEFAPVFNSQAININPSIVQQSGVIPNSPQETSFENTLSGGVMAVYKVSKRLVVKSGFVYNAIRQTTKNVGLLGANSIYSMGGPAVASTPAGQVYFDKTVESSVDPNLQPNINASGVFGGQLKQELQFIEIPVQATYKLVDRKVSVGLTGGVGTNILVGNKAMLTANGNQVSNGETSGMRNIVYSGSIGLEMGYEISNRISLTIGPYFKQFINSLNTNKSANYKPSQIGMVTGLAYSFN